MSTVLAEPLISSPASLPNKNEPPATISHQPTVTIVIACCNQAPVTKRCLDSLRHHTTWPHQLLLVDNGSTDETSTVLQQYAQQGYPGLIELAIIRNSQNLGFAAGVNQALQRATGDYVVLLNNDTVLTPSWLEGLLGVALNVESAGMIGPVSNEVPDLQRVLPGYRPDLHGLDTFAQNRRVEYACQVMEVERLSGFCLLIPKPVLQSVGLLDERFGLGFFEDDDWGIRVRQAGYRLLIALDTYIHHWGSQTFRGLGISTEGLLQTNLEKFREKWGSELAGRYRFPGAESPSVTSDVPATVSLCMIVKNEEANLADCLRGMNELVNEIVVVDTGSTDRTKAIAEEHGARVIDFPWVDSFAAARNVAIENATSDYIFWLDADDRVDATNRSQIRELFATLRTGELYGTSMQCLCLPDPVTGITTVVDHIRLFPRHPDIRWKYRIHEQILPSLRRLGGGVRFADIHIHHVGYQDPALRHRKLQRDIRLLLMEDAETPDDPFTLFNLGSVYLELEQTSQAIPLLERSLARSHPSDSIVRKLYALLVQAHKRMKHYPAAIACCQEGQKHYPQDAELLFQEGLLRRDCGDLPGAAQALERLLQTREGHHFGSVDVGLRGYKARHNLAVIYRDLGRVPDALALWNQVLVESPSFIPARLGLAETYTVTGDASAFQEHLSVLQQQQDMHLDCKLLQAKWFLARKEFESARQLLLQLQADYPSSLQPKVLLSHVYLQEGKDTLTARRLLEEILVDDPENREARHNLEVLKRQHLN